ncbi:MAG: hypothetical protein AAF674_16575 [Pseudomonadota bacterium]
MAEPVFIAQTFERAIVYDLSAFNLWMRQQIEVAKSRGANWGRATLSDAHDGVLYEAWTERPDDEGQPRWSLAAGNGVIH